VLKAYDIRKEKSIDMCFECVRDAKTWQKGRFWATKGIEKVPVLWPLLFRLTLLILRFEFDEWRMAVS